MKKQKTILIVPPRGIPIKAFRIRVWVAILLAIVITIGFVGYFIPFDNFTLNVVEQNQKKNLTEQNKALLQRILSTLRLLNSLKEQIARLEEKRQYVLKFGIIGPEHYDEKTNMIQFDELSTEEILAYVDNQERRIEKFVSKVSEQNNIFDHIPVIKPVFEPATMTRKYGPAQDPFTGKQKTHHGIDFIGEKGACIIATASGNIRRIENHPVWGKRVFIDHGNGYETVYAHIGELKVSGGQNVERGAVIGYIGLSGLTSGPHVHYELWIKGTPVNPADYFFPAKLF